MELIKSPYRVDAGLAITQANFPALLHAFNFDSFPPGLLTGVAPNRIANIVSTQLNDLVGTSHIDASVGGTWTAQESDRKLHCNDDVVNHFRAYTMQGPLFSSEAPSSKSRLLIYLGQLQATTDPVALVGVGDESPSAAYIYGGATPSNGYVTVNAASSEMAAALPITSNAQHAYALYFPLSAVNYSPTWYCYKSGAGTVGSTTGAANLVWSDALNFSNDIAFVTMASGSTGMKGLYSFEFAQQLNDTMIKTILRWMACNPLKGLPPILKGMR